MLGVNLMEIYETAEKIKKYSAKYIKKVCIITCSDSPLDSRVFYNEAKSLKKFGYDVTK